MKLVALGTALLVLVSGCDKLAEKAGEKAAEKAIESTTGGEVKAETYVALATKDPPAKVAEFYKKTGLKLESEVNLGAVQTMTFKNGTGTATVVMQQAGGDTQVTIACVN